jgi:hypothetical protein
VSDFIDKYFVYFLDFGYAAMIVVISVVYLTIARPSIVGESRRNLEQRHTQGVK